MIARNQSTAPAPPMIFHRLVAPAAGYVCFCGVSAHHMRETEGLIWPYCERHWALWQQRHQRDRFAALVHTVIQFPEVAPVS